jgi:hypothetical protein
MSIHKYHGMRRRSNKVVEFGISNETNCSRRQNEDNFKMEIQRKPIYIRGS